VGTEARLRLVGHCVETAAKMEFKRLMDAAFEETGDTADLEARIELIRAFLEEADFPALRSSDPRLAGEVEAEVNIARGDDGAFSITFG